ncbi:MAG: lipopolysaccharide core heptose(I) kinase RfaP [Deltaproteobacteria bacterium]|nr:lipopolysaccharide core heptose(I) kinase RfaP [Deltaproteobacteria bacterium]
MKLVLNPPFDALWSGRDPFSAVEELTGAVFRELEGRRTLRTEIGGRGFFVKIHRGIGWREIFKNLLSFRWPVLGAGNEWQAVTRLQELGVPTMKVAAFGCRGRNPACQHSFIITEDLGDTVSLEDFTRDWAKTPPVPRLKWALIHEVGRMARAMHQGGVNHRDFYLCHFLLHKDPPCGKGRIRLALIDLHRAQVRSSVPRRWRNKDLAGLYFSALEIGLTQRDLMRFLKIYFGLPLRDIFGNEAALLNQLRLKAQRLQVRFQRKYAVAQ